MKISREPQPATATAPYGETAWWYEGRNSIDVVVRLSDGRTTIATIKRRRLADWINRTEMP